MHHVTRFLAALFLSILSMQASAQVTMTVRSSGVVSSGGTVPGLLSADTGAPYTLEVTSVFPETAPWISWPNFLNAGDVPFTVSLTVDGTTHEISGTSQMNLATIVAVRGGVPYHLVNYNIAMYLPGDYGRLNFSSVFYLEPQTEPMILADLFDHGRPMAVSPLAPNSNSVILYHGRSPGVGFYGSAASVSYATIGAPLSPVPEPSSAAMLLAGIALAGAAARRRRRP